MRSANPHTPSRPVLMHWAASMIAALPTTLALATGPTTAAKEDAPDQAFLQALPDEVDQPHEGIPDGVPSSYDWQRKGKRDRWNDPPAHFSAITGWGQVFWTRDASAGASADSITLQLRNHQTWLCENNVWRKVQASIPTGAQYRADFAGNTAKRPRLMKVEHGVLNVQFEPGTAFHFWPGEGRVDMSPQNLCGVLVLVQARVRSNHPGAEPKLLIGLGADYWLSRTSQWDNYKTNSAVGIGKLRQVQQDWTWYGLSTNS
jgi:hypothetical protein